MVYFLIKNDFDFYNVDFLAGELINQYELSLIQVPYSLNVIKEDNRFISILTFERVHSVKSFSLNGQENLFVI